MQLKLMATPDSSNPFRRMALSFATAGLMVVGAAKAKVVADVDLPNTMPLGGQALVLASCGVRDTLWIEHYVAALYLRPGQTIVATSDPAQPKVILMHIVRGASLPEQIPEQWRAPLREELEREPLARVRASYAALGSGDRVLVTYRPGAGVSLAVNERVVATAPSHALIDSILKTWADGDPLSGKLQRLAMKHTC